MAEKGPGSGLLRSALKRMRRRVTAERFRLALKLVSRLTARPGQLRAQRAPNAKEASDLEKTSLPENPRPRGLVPATGRERGVPRARAMPIPPGDVEPPPLVDKAGNLPQEKAEGTVIFPRGAPRGVWTAGAEGGAAGRLAGSIPAPGAPFRFAHSLRSLPVQFRGAGGPLRSRGPARPVTWDGPGRLPEHPGGSRAPGGGAQPARGAEVTWGWFQVAAAEARGGGTGAARTPGRAGRWG